MKKTILAVVTTSLFAASANAATVFDKDGQQLDVTGRIQYQAGQFKNDSNGKAENFGGDTIARLGLAGKQATGYNDVALIGKLEWQLSSEADDANTFTTTSTTTNGVTSYTTTQSGDSNKITSRYAFAGADFANGVQATVGTQDSAYVQLADVTDVYNEYSGNVEYQLDGDSRWDDSVKVTYVADGWDLRGSVSFADSAKANGVSTKVQDRYAGSAGYTFQIDDISSLKSVVAYQAINGEVAGANYTNTQYALGLGYTYDAFYLATTYGQAKYEEKSSVILANSQKDNVWAVTGTYKVQPAVTLVAGYGLVDPHNSGDASGEWGEYYVLGAQYDITTKAKAFTEYKINQVAGQDDNYYVGLQYNF
jgi:predicted porin